MNKQEIFDTVVRHLHAQGKPALNDANCRYRSDAGLSCAVGCLIPDEFYDPQMENQTPSMPRVKSALRASGIIKGNEDQEDLDTLGLLGALQYAHDHWEGGDACGYAWGDETPYLEDVAEQFNLTWPEGIPHA